MAPGEDLRVDAYVELHCHSCFSFLDGASPPEALLDRALALGMDALALTDHNGLYGAIRFMVADFFSPTRFETLVSERVPVRLGHQVFLNGRLANSTMEAAVEAFFQGQSYLIILL